MLTAQKSKKQIILIPLPEQKQWLDLLKYLHSVFTLYKRSSFFDDRLRQHLSSNSEQKRREILFSEAAFDLGLCEEHFLQKTMIALEQKFSFGRKRTHDQMEVDFLFNVKDIIEGYELHVNLISHANELEVLLHNLGQDGQIVKAIVL